eukprot:14803011-Heterocapsa_arctica.AAC.1
MTLWYVLVGFAKPRRSGDGMAEQFSHAARQSQAQGVEPVHSPGLPKSHAARQTNKLESELRN